MSYRVLVVEDDFLVRLIVSHYLKSMGWQVEEVSTGEAALAQFSENSSPIDAVLTDLRLPDMGGMDLASRPEVDCPVIFMSGVAVLPEGLPGPVLRKPFDEDTLRSVLAEVLPNAD